MHPVCNGDMHEMYLSSHQFLSCIPNFLSFFLLFATDFSKSATKDLFAAVCCTPIANARDLFATGNTCPRQINFII